MDIKIAPRELVYIDIQRQWQELSRLFSKDDPRGAPLLAIFNVENVDKEGWKVKDTLEFHPDTPPEETVKRIISGTYDTFGACRYSKDVHAVVINRAVSNGHFPMTLAEEVTHSVIPVTHEIVRLAPEDFKEFNGYAKGFGDLAYRILQPLKIGEFKLNLNEFFPPIGQVHLEPNRFDTEKYDWEKAFRVTESMPSYSEDLFFRKAMRAHNLTEHVPQIAGALLVGAYKGDIGALVREHPQLAHLDGTQLWVQYCKPLLTSGKLG
jgi:hypothetical protein